VLEGGIRLGALGEGVVDEVEEPFVAAGAFESPPAGVEGEGVDARQRPRQRRDSAPVRTTSPPSGSSSRMRTSTSSPRPLIRSASPADTPRRRFDLLRTPIVSAAAPPPPPDAIGLIDAHGLCMV